MPERSRRQGEPDVHDRRGERCHAVIKVFGVGGGGSNAINTMIEEGWGRRVHRSDTDAQALSIASRRSSSSWGPAHQGARRGANPISPSGGLETAT